MIIAEAPGDWEEHLGRPLVGPAGQRLMRELKKAGVVALTFTSRTSTSCGPERARAGRSLRPQMRSKITFVI
jgi:uracil-DNA glycosylase family 4